MVPQYADNRKPARPISKHTITESYTFDDLLLVPRYSDIESRKDVSLHTAILGVSIPIVSANMKSVTEYEMAKAMEKLNGLAILHRFMTIEKNIDIFKECNPHYTGCSVGVKNEDYERVSRLVRENCDIICVDIAHGDSLLARQMISYIKNNYPEVFIIAGNVCTGRAAVELAEHGAHVIKVGIGPGSLCSTRIKTGNGVPQMSALMDVYYAREDSGLNFGIIADGGIRNSGDIVKALCFSDMVMLGSLLAGTEEAASLPIEKNGKKYKIYQGSSTYKNENVEGVVGLVPSTGPVAKVIDELLQGVRSGLSYQGVRSIKELHEIDKHFVKITNAGLAESHPHDIGSL